VTEAVDGVPDKWDGHGLRRTSFRLGKSYFQKLKGQLRERGRDQQVGDWEGLDRLSREG